MTLDTYYVFYHPDSKTYLNEYRKLVSSWELAKRHDQDAKVPNWTGLLPHHPLCNLRLVKIDIAQEEIG